jgi:hypothetical protein
VVVLSPSHPKFAPLALGLAGLFTPGVVRGQGEVLPTVAGDRVSAVLIEFPDGQRASFEVLGANQLRDGQVVTISDQSVLRSGVVRGGSAAEVSETDPFSVEHARNIVNYQGPERLREYVLQEITRAHGELSWSWLGVRKPLPPLSIELAIREDFTRGTTWFEFAKDGLDKIRMELSAREAALGTLLWHEVSHVVLNKHFERSRVERGVSFLRWIDEGAAVSVEYGHVHRQMLEVLIKIYIQGKEDADVRRVLAVRGRPEPDSVAFFYPASFTLVEYLVSCSPGQDVHSKRRYFISFAEELHRRGGDLEAHEEAFKRWYGINGLPELQSRWLEWVNTVYQPGAAPSAASADGRAR